MRTTLLAILITLFSASHIFAIDAHRMKVVQTMIDSAKTQADLNFASKMLFEIWDDEVKKKESEVLRMLPKKFSKDFRETMVVWRKHVESMSIIRSELFKQDFMEPKYYRLYGIESKVGSLKRANTIKPYVYNMSKAIYYEEKWIELDVLINTR